MTQHETFNFVVVIWIGLAFVITPQVSKLAAPYGRHFTKKFGPTIDNRLGWIVMELVSPATFAFFFLRGDQIKTPVTWLFLGIWLLHYGYRSLIFPMRQRTRGKRMPVAIMASAIFFNVVNGFLNGQYLGEYGPVYAESWLTGWPFVAGMALFLLGMLVNWHSDNILLHLRKPGETGYKIPRGGLFRWISCPNYLGEMIEWGGFALLTWSLPAASFFIWTAANLIPRALAHHDWYDRTFEDYPRNRKAILPFLL